MALLNISCSNLSLKQTLSLPPRISLLSLGQAAAKAGFLALLSSSLFFVDPALAFKANLGNANLEGALATGNTSFRGSNITGADFTDVPLREDQREYLCKVADG